MRGRKLNLVNHNEWLVRRMELGRIPRDEKLIRKVYDSFSELEGATTQLLETNRLLLEMVSNV